jgi:CheY-like chemotaxis protein
MVERMDESVGAGERDADAAVSILLVHWHEAEAHDLAATLKEAGFRVEVEARDGARAVARAASMPAEVVVISLRRVPSHGRETARELQARVATRHIPIVFVDGPPAKQNAVRRVVPAASFVSWSELSGELGRIAPQRRR